MRSLKIESLVARVDWTLEGRVPRRRRRQIRDELRASLAAAANELGEEEAIRRLGDLRELTGAYLEAESGRVNVRSGVYAALAVLALLELFGIAMLASFREGVGAAAGDGSASFSLWPYSFEAGRGEGLRAALTIAWPALLGLPLLAFLLWGRAWRLFGTTSS